MRILKILYVSPFFSPIIGGVESVLETTCNALVQRGHTVEVLTGSVDKVDSSPPTYSIKRSDVLKVPDEGMLAPEEFDYDSAVSLMNERVREFDPNIIHFQNFQMRQYSMFLNPFIEGINRSKQVTVNTVHNDSDDTFCHYVLSYSPLDQVIAVTNRASIDLMEGGVPSGKVTSIPNMLDTERFRTADGREVRKSLGVDSDTPLILFPSRLIGREGDMLLDSKKGKGLMTLLRAMPEVLDDVPNAKLLLLGNDHVFKDKVSKVKRLLKEIASRIGIRDGILFFDEYVTNDMLPSVFASSDIVVSLSSRETFGMVFAEAMAAGKPVIGVNSPAGGVSEVVKDGVTGYLVPADDSHITSQAITRILGDEDLSRQMGLQGSRIARARFDTSVVTPKLLTTYSLLVRQKIEKPKLKVLDHDSQRTLSNDRNLNIA